MKTVKIDCTKIADEEILKAFEAIEYAGESNNEELNRESWDEFDKMVISIPEEIKNKNAINKEAVQALQDFSDEKINLDFEINISHEFWEIKAKEAIIKIDEIVNNNKFVPDREFEKLKRLLPEAIDSFKSWSNLTCLVKRMKNQPTKELRNSISK